MNVHGIVCMTVLFVILASCTKEKTDYTAEMERALQNNERVFEEALRIQEGAWKISIQTLGGEFYTGYNAVRLKITEVGSGQFIQAKAVHWLPILTTEGGQEESVPHQRSLSYVSETENSTYFTGFTMFTAESSEQIDWTLFMEVELAEQTLQIEHPLTVQQQPNKNLHATHFTGLNGRIYFLALIAPERPTVGENTLIAGLYTHGETPLSFKQADGYTLVLDPRMPESSMGNHSSPNNVDLTQRNDGNYQGIVHYTMTGNWTLNFILQDEVGVVIKGTEVPDDFTPGVEGVKSELYIDVLF